MTNNEHRTFFQVSFSTTFVLSIASILAGCSGSAQVHGSSDASKADATNTQSVPSAKSAKSSATTSGTNAPRGSASPANSPFHIVADVDYAAELQRLGKTSVLVASGQLLPIRDNTVTFDAKFALSSEMVSDGVRGAFQTLLGSFPDALYASVVRPSGRTGFTELYKWSGSKWTSHYSSDESTFVLDIQPWQNGSVLMVEAHSFSGEYRFSVLPKSAKVFVPEPYDRKWKGASSMCEMGFIPDALRTLPSGHVFMTGVICSLNDGPQSGQTAIKHWSAENKAGTIDALPDVGNKNFTLVNLALHNDKDAYVGKHRTFALW